jgi:hypothetical protein
MRVLATSLYEVFSLAVTISYTPIERLFSPLEFLFFFIFLPFDGSEELYKEGSFTDYGEESS